METMLRSIKCDCHCDQESNMVMVMVMVHICVYLWEEGRGGEIPPTMGRWGGGEFPPPGMKSPPLRDTQVGGKSPPGGISLLLGKEIHGKDVDFLSMCRISFSQSSTLS